MAQITIARALKCKNRVIERMRKLERDIQNCNSVLQGGERDIVIEDALKERMILENHLVGLKLQLDASNAPIKESIVKLQELKARIAFLTGISTVHGKIDARRTMYGEQGEVHYEAVLRKSQLDEMVSVAQEEIDSIQEFIDQFNNTTKIAVNVLPLK